MWLGVGASTSVWQWVLVMSQSGNSAFIFTSNPQSQRVFFPLNTHNVTLWLFIHEKEQNIKGTLRLAATHRVTCSALSPISPLLLQVFTHLHFYFKIDSCLKNTRQVEELKYSWPVLRHDRLWMGALAQPCDIFTIVNSDWRDIYSYYK